MQITSNFEKYRKEVMSGSLDWSPMHTSDLFWRENTEAFEEKDYAVLRQLLKIVETSRDVRQGWGARGKGAGANAGSWLRGWRRWVLGLGPSRSALLASRQAARPGPAGVAPDPHHAHAALTCAPRPPPLCPAP